MKESFELKRKNLRSVIRRFVEGKQVLDDDKTAYFMRLTSDLVPSDIEYLAWAIEKGQFLDAKQGEDPKGMFGGIAERARKEESYRRNLNTLVTYGLAKIEPVWDGSRYSLTDLGFEYYDFVVGNQATRA